MRRRPTPFVPPALLALAVVALLAACGAPAAPTGGDPDPDPTGGDPTWEMLVTRADASTFTVTGTGVSSPSATVLELDASAPAGWSVSFVVDGGGTIGIPYTTDAGTLLSAEVAGPTGVACVVTPLSGGSAEATLTFGLPVDDVPTGIAIVEADEPCVDLVAPLSFQLGFGVQ